MKKAALFYSTSLSGKWRLFLIQPKKYYRYLYNFLPLHLSQPQIKQSNFSVCDTATKNHFLEWWFNCSNIYSIWHLFGDTTITWSATFCPQNYRVVFRVLYTYSSVLYCQLSSHITLYGCWPCKTWKLEVNNNLCCIPLNTTCCVLTLFS